jgi:hypothetical protein
VLGVIARADSGAECGEKSGDDTETVMLGGRARLRIRSLRRVGSSAGGLYDGSLEATDFFLDVAAFLGALRLQG